MSGLSVTDRVFDLLRPLAESRDFELVATEVCGPKGSPIVRVYLDREGGVDLDAIAEANSWISDALDAEPPASGSYVLEVSSPGLERPLRRPEDFERFAGAKALVKTVRPIDGRKRFTGLLQGMEGEDILIDCDGETCRVPHDALAKANLQPEIDFGSERTDE